MTGAAEAHKGSRTSGFLSSPWTAVIASVIAIAVVVAGIVAVDLRATEPTTAAAPARGETAPSDFVFDLQATSSPMVKRGEPVTLTLSGPTDAAIARVELWRDGELIYDLDDTSQIVGAHTDQVRFAMDVVNMEAGAHLFIARAYDAGGRMAQSQPIALPTMDRPEDLGTFVATDADGAGVWPAFSLGSAPGDSLESVAKRLGVAPSALTAGNGATDPRAALPIGTVIKGVVPPVDQLVKPQWDSPFDTDIDAVVDGCDVVVTSSTPGDLRVYGGAGMVALGDLPQGGELRLTNLPIGPTILAAYSPAGAEPKLPASIPITVTVPDECARDGWTGDAYINGGVLLSDYSVPQAYVYLAVDKGGWQRFPQQEGTYLNGASTTMADLRQYVSLASYDQLDLEVWSGARGEGPVATGHYCRAESRQAGTGGSSASGGECTPQGATTPGAPGSAPPATLGIDVEAVTAGPQEFSKGVWVDTPPPGIAFQATQNGSLDVRLSTNAHDLDVPGDVYYQFSYLPLTAGSAGANLPGIFYTARAAADGSLVVNPWDWHAAKATPESLDEVDHLALSDEIAWGIARQRLLEGRSLIDTVYVRAVTMMDTGGALAFAGAASAAGAIVMPPTFAGEFPLVADPTLSIRAGRELPDLSTAQTTGVGGGATTPREPCVQVVRYPAPNVYELYPGSQSYTGPDGKTYAQPPVGKTGYSPIFNSGMSDLNVALTDWPSGEFIYCQDSSADVKREAAANAAARDVAQCGIGCVFSMVVFGAMQGFLVGGPYGALVGAAIGLGVGVASSLDPNFYALVTQAWDAISSVYNAVFTEVWKIVDATNLVCIGAGSLSKEAQSLCNDGFQAVGSAVLAYYTGVPPTLPNSKEALALAEGDVEAFVYAQLDALLRSLGTSCDDFSIPTGTLKSMNDSAGSKGYDTADIEVVMDKDGNLSGCAAVANIFGKAVSKMAEHRQGQILGAITGERAVPGLVLGLIGDEQPTLVITAPRDQGLQKGKPLQCPYVANIEVTENGSTRRLKAVEGVLWSKNELNTETGSSTTSPWMSELTIPRSNAAYSATNGTSWWTEPPSQSVREVVKAAPGAPYLRVVVDSPCFAVSQSISVDEYVAASGGFGVIPGAYYLDSRTIKTYW